MTRSINAAILLWLGCYSALCYANTTFAQDVATYDWLSLLLALVAGLLGGAGRTVITLVREDVAVGNTRALLAKDLVVALVGGGVTFLIVEGYNVAAEALHWVRVDRGLRVLVLVWAGYSRGKWLGLVDDLATDLIARVRYRVRGDIPLEILAGGGGAAVAIPAPPVLPSGTATPTTNDTPAEPARENP